MKVMPSSSTAVGLMIAIEFNRGSSVNTPTWCASCQRFTGKPTYGYTKVVDCR